MAFAAIVFRRAGNPVLFYALGGGRVQVVDETERLQLQIAAAEVRVLDVSNYLLTLTVLNAARLTAAQTVAAQATDTALLAADLAEVK